MFGGRMIVSFPAPRVLDPQSRLERADAVSWASAMLRRGLTPQHEWTVNGEGRCLGEGPANKPADENAKIPCSPENSVLAH